MTHGWFFWALIVLVAVGPLIYVLDIGKDRKPITKESAALSVIINAALIFLLFHYWGR